MADKNIISNLARYFYEMKNDATSHDKIVLLLSIVIWVGCGVGAFRNLSITVHWPKALLTLVAVFSGIVVWLGSFALGVFLRAPNWQHVFPPYRLIGKITIPALVIAIVVGSMVGITFFKESLANCVGASSLGYIFIILVMHFLYLLRGPIANKAVQIFHDPNILTVNSHRSVWIYPAIGVLVLFMIARRYISVELEAMWHIAVIASITASITYAGFGSGYIP